MFKEREVQPPCGIKRVREGRPSPLQYDEKRLVWCVLRSFYARCGPVLQENANTAVGQARRPTLPRYGDWLPVAYRGRGMNRLSPLLSSPAMCGVQFSLFMPRALYGISDQRDLET